MKYQVTPKGDTTEAIGAYSGYRIRIVTQRDTATGKFPLKVYFRGSESLPENAVDVGAITSDTAAGALERGYALAVAWIDRLDSAAA
jgi:hypothetical protein